VLRNSAVEMLRNRFGEIARSFGPIPFTFTDYYVAEMGQGIQREILSFERPIDPGSLAEIKLLTNALEQELAQGSGHQRPVNLDPGVMDRYKLVLASTKPGPMRVPIRSGVYGEVTLCWIKGAFDPHRLTYADYRTDEVRSFLALVRSDLLRMLKTEATGDGHALDSGQIR
jgi:hypothetical protein